MVDKPYFVQFPHPGGEHRPARGAQVIGWNERYRNHKQNPHKRKFMQLHGEWTDEDRTNKGCGDLWAWGEWEPESKLIRKFCPPARERELPHNLWDPYYIPKNGYEGLHNTDPFIFGDRILYSNCGQTAESKRSLKCLGRGSVIAFGSGKRIKGEWKWMLDTVLVVKDSYLYDPLNPRNALKGKVPEAFLDVTGGPLADNPEQKTGSGACGPGETQLRLYMGATPEDPVHGMFSFFPAKPAGGGAGFPRPIIEKLPGKYFTPGNTQAPKGATQDRKPEQLRYLWRLLVAQVQKDGLVLGTRAEPPLRRP